MTTATLKVKNGAIVLPKKLQKAWKGARVMVRVSPDTVVIKKMQPSSFWESWEKMRTIRKNVTGKDIDKAIAWARRGQKKK